jgi:hypothetical protein
VWADISIDFIERLPKVGVKSVILTVVDRFSKYAYFVALGHPYTASSVAEAFFDGIVRLHGFPTSIVSERDPVFTGNVWRDLFKMVGVKLCMSTAFHPQADGQSEVVNKVIVMYLRCIILPSTPLFGRHLLRWCMVGHPRPSCHTHLPQHAQMLRILSYGIATTS